MTKWLKPTNEVEMKACLDDPMWRLFSGNLYKIMIKGDDDEDNLVIPFIPNASQINFIENLHFRNIILKARQLGFTTLIAIYYLDCVMFRANVRAGIIAQAREIAETIFRDKVQFAYLNLPESLRMAMPLARDSASELLFSHNNSSIRVGTSMRSGTLHYLHVSEFGKICAEHPKRANEVITGSMPAVTGNGVLIVESTAEGPDGHFHDMSDRAEKLSLSGKKLTNKDFKFHFYPWWKEVKYAMSADDVVITAKDHEYFDKIEVDAGTKLSLEQRAWWCSTRDSLFSGAVEKMWQEFPSTSKEAFQQSTEGCYYTVQMTAARKQGRITSVPYRPGYPVNTFWDIGSGDGTAIWFHQRVGQFDNFIKFIEGWDEPYSYYVGEMQKTGWVWGTHYLPHDGNHIRQGKDENVSPKVMLEQLRLTNIEIVPPVDRRIHGIQATRVAMSSCWFDETECKEGIIHMDGYRKTYSASNERFTDEPVKNVHTEAADAFRQFGQGYKGEGKPKKARPKMAPRRFKDRMIGY